MTETAKEADTGDFEGKECKGSSYGKFASELRKGRYLVNREILEHIGTDDEYGQWTARQICSISNSRKQSECWKLRSFVKPGISMLSDYHAIPLSTELCCELREGSATVKSLLEHYSIITDPTSTEVEFWINNTATKNLHNWAWYALKKILGYEHWSEIPPSVVQKWSKENNIIHLFPACYRIL